MSKSKRPKLKQHINPKTKKRLFREMLGILIEKTVDDNLHFEMIIYRIRECSSGLMFQFSDGITNVMELQEHDAVWKTDGKRSKFMDSYPGLKKRLKKLVMRIYYE